MLAVVEVMFGVNQVLEVVLLAKLVVILATGVVVPLTKVSLTMKLEVVCVMFQSAQWAEVVVFW